MDLSIIEEDLKAVDVSFQEYLSSRVPLITKIGKHILTSGGKRIRPAILLLCSRLNGYAGERAIRMASIIEFIHTATLLHDDVVDNADIRRGNPAANTLWGSEASVLVGDFLFSKSFYLMVDDGDLRILGILAEATTELAEGEILELVKTGDLSITKHEYMGLITSKTAVLISAASRIGAVLGDASDEIEGALKDYGLHIGIAFQLVDDCLDYTATNESLGKTIGTDLREGKVTLPLILSLEKASKEERKRVQDIVLSDEIVQGTFEEVQGMIQKYAGIEATLDLAREHVDMAKVCLKLLPQKPEREALENLADYIVQRDR
jgi:octaprenyl-diphosphate synthase